MKSKISSAGSFLFLLGIASIVLYFINYTPTLLAWLYDLDQTLAWAIRIGVTVLGGLIYLASKKMKD
ncbi:MAG TPA: hypothetical protein PK624_10755 [Spirochaetota bacterium]|nr:hypothetical protein [Spirochaetota bacterium]HOR45263.1 hypothetical protein [Spirochaetota bacterium]HPK57483.1 hypothetical protein [Spirochaetota bacterium]